MSAGEFEKILNLLADHGWIEDRRKAEPAEVNPDERFKVGCRYSDRDHCFDVTESMGLAGKPVGTMKHWPDCPQCHPVKAELKPEDYMDPKEFFIGGHTYISLDDQRYVIKEGTTIIGKKIIPPICHDPGCHKCMGVIVLSERPIAVGDRFRVADVLADPALRARLEGCDARALWIEYEWSKFPIEQMLSIIEKHHHKIRPKIWIEIASLPAPVEPAFHINTDPKENITATAGNFSIDPDPPHEPDDFRTVFRPGHLYTRTTLNGVKEKCGMPATNSLDGRRVPFNVEHDARNCPACHKAAKARRTMAAMA